jgi:hypothetical protein
VATGFTPGELGPDGRYHVRDEHAHAWPEVYFDGVGWAAFEPTPERFEPSPGNHTGTYRPPAAGPPDRAGTSTAPLSTPAAAVARAPRDGLEGDRGPLSREEPGVGVPLVASGLLAGLGLLLLVPPMLKERRRRVRQGGRAGQRVAGAWSEVLDRLAEAGLRPRAPETPLEFARRAAAVRPAAGPPLDRLALLVSRCAYGAGAPAEADGSSAWRAVGEVTRALGAGEPRWSRWRRWLDPRPLLAPT